MRYLLRLLLTTFFPFLVTFAQTPVGSSTITLGVGGEVTTRSVANESTGPVFNGNYEFRLLKYLSLEAGVSNMLPRVQRYEVFPVYTGAPTVVCSGYLCPPYVFATIPDRTRVTFLPFGFRGILPFWRSRVEFFAGGGGAYAWHGDGSFNNAWLMQATLGGRIALDNKHRFWAGTSGRFYSNTGFNRQQWLSWTADIGFRFGRRE